MLARVAQRWQGCVQAVSGHGVSTASLPGHQCPSKYGRPVCTPVWMLKLQVCYGVEYKVYNNFKVGDFTHEEFHFSVAVPDGFRESVKATMIEVWEALCLRKYHHAKMCNFVKGDNVMALVTPYSADNWQTTNILVLCSMCAKKVMFELFICKLNTCKCNKHFFKNPKIIIVYLLPGY